MKPLVGLPGTYLVKATDTGNNDEFLGFAGWQTPERKPLMNLFRRDAVDKLNFAKRVGWTEGEVEEMWSNVDTSLCDAALGGYDAVRHEIMDDEGHWFLAPLWVFPEHQGQGVAGLLLRHVMAIADSYSPPQPMYLEAHPTARPIYERLGWVGCEGKKFAMVRRGPKTDMV